MPCKAVIFYSLGLTAILLMGGCASTPQLSREEQLRLIEAQKKADDDFIAENMTRVYSKSKQEILDAAAAVLMLADPSDVSIAHNPQGFVATRKWTWYAVLAADRGVDTWDLTVTPLSDGRQSAVMKFSTTSTMHNQNYTYVYGVGVMPIGTPTTTTITNFMRSPALYKLFWQRVEYKLGLRKTWPDCASYKAIIANTSLAQDKISGLCGPLAKDELPEELRPSSAAK